MMLRGQLLTECQLDDRHRQTYESIGGGTETRDLEWHDVRLLLTALAEVNEGADGSLHAVRNGETLTLSAENLGRPATAAELLEVRRFLECSCELTAPRLLVIVGHHAAKIYRDTRRETGPRGFVAYDPLGCAKLLAERGDENDTDPIPERKSYYDAIAMTLRGAGEILIFGSGGSMSRAMDQLVVNLNRNHAEVSERIIGAIVVDMHGMSEAQLLAGAGDFFDSEG